MAWGFVMPKLEWDGVKYDNIVTQRKYAAYCKRCSDKNLTRIPYEDWLELDEQQRKQLLAPASDPQWPAAAEDGCIPTAATAATANATTSAATITAETTDTKINSSSKENQKPSLSSEPESRLASAAPSGTGASAEKERVKATYKQLRKGESAMTDKQRISLWRKWPR